MQHLKKNKMIGYHMFTQNVKWQPTEVLNNNTESHSIAHIKFIVLHEDKQGHTIFVIQVRIDNFLYWASKQV